MSFALACSRLGQHCESLRKSAVFGGMLDETRRVFKTKGEAAVLLVMCKGPQDEVL